MKIAIFEGKFNPVSKSHLLVAQEAINKYSLDKVIFVPVFKDLFNQDGKMESGEHRLKMLEVAIGEKMEVSSFGINRKAPFHTIELFNFLQNKYKNAQFYILMGSDRVSKFPKWKDIETLSNEAKIVVFKRNNNFSKEIIRRFKGELVKNEIFEYSSYEFRKGQMHNVTKPVIDYIASNLLYVEPIMASMLDAKRHKHSLAVASMAAELAKKNNFDAKRAYFAGAMHDITKWWPKEAHREFLTYVGEEESDFLDYELHAVTGYYWLKTQYQLKDEMILNSVLRHTTLAKELTILDKIIFAADKLAEGRKFECIQDIRKLINEDFEKGFKAIVKKTWEQLEDSRDLSEETRELLRRWS